jgi:hypothetical protein
MKTGWTPDREDGLSRRRGTIFLATAVLASAVFASVRCGWGTGASGPKQQAEALMKSGLPIAQAKIAGAADFDAFGAVMTTGGAIEPVAPPKETEQDAALDPIDLLEKGFRARAGSGELRATAIFVSARVQPPDEAGTTDAIEVLVEHREGYCANVFYPYARTDDGTVSYRAPFAVPRDGTIFGTCDRTQ